MNDQRHNVLQHMRMLWNNWGGSFHKNVKSKSLHKVLRCANGCGQGWLEMVGQGTYYYIKDISYSY